MRETSARTAAKHRQRVRGPRHGAPKETVVVEADAVVMAEGSTGEPDDHGLRGSTGVEERGTRTEAPQEPGRSRRLLTNAEQRANRNQARGLREPRVERAGAHAEHEHDAHVRHRRAKETKLEAAEATRGRRRSPYR